MLKLGGLAAYRAAYADGGPTRLVAGGAEGRVPLPKDYKLPQYPPGDYMGPMPEGEFYDPLSNKLGRQLTKDFPALQPVDDWMQQHLDFGLGDLPITPMVAELPQRIFERGREASISQSLDPIKKLKDEVPSDVMKLEGLKLFPYAGKVLKKGAKAGIEQVKRLGRVLTSDSEPEIVGVHE